MVDNFRLEIKITRQTTAGRALSLMARGVIVVYQEREKADEAFDEFLLLSEMVLNHVDEVYFGVVALVDLRSGVVVNTKALFGRGSDPDRKS